MQPYKMIMRRYLQALESLGDRDLGKVHGLVAARDRCSCLRLTPTLACNSSHSLQSKICALTFI
jgi:hypothetical protein